MGDTEELHAPKVLVHGGNRARTRKCGESGSLCFEHCQLGAFGPAHAAAHLEQGFLVSYT